MKTSKNNLSMEILSEPKDEEVNSTINNMSLKQRKALISSILTSVSFGFGNKDEKYKIDYMLQKKILMRDNYKCIFCHHNKNLEIHHIIPRYLNNFLRDDELNLITLCKECHKMVQKMFDITLKVWRIEFNKLIKQSIESI